MLQLLYRHCAMWAPRPRYWPADLVEALVDSPAGSSEDAAKKTLRDRQQLYPLRVSPEANAQLGMFWWGLRGGIDTFAVSEGDFQIKTHITGLADAISRSENSTHARLLVALDAVCLLGSLVPPLGVPLVAAAQYGLSWVEAVKSMPSVGKRLVEMSPNKVTRIDQARRRNDGRDLSLGGRDAALTDAERDGRALAMVSGVVPFAIVVDEAQLLDDVTLGMLKVMVGQGVSRGLIVLAVNTDLSKVATPDSTGKALTAWLDQLQRAGRLFSIDLPPMTPRELLEVAKLNLPALPKEEIGKEGLATVIAASHGAPGRLASMLQVSSIQDAITHGQPLPEDPEQFTEQGQAKSAFEALPPQARTSVATVAIHGLITYTSWLTSAPGGDLDGPIAMTSAELDTAISTGWVQRTQDGSVRFTSRLLYRVARAQRSADVTIPRRQRAWQSLAAWVAAEHESEAWLQVPAFVAESVLTALTSELPAGVGDPEDQWAAELLRMRNVTGRRADEATLSALEERLRTERPLTILVVATAEALFDAGHTLRAFDVLQTELDRLTARYGAGAPGTFPALQNLAIAWAAQARYHSGHPEAAAMFEHAINLYRLLLTGRKHHEKAGDKRIPDTRWNLAQLLADIYQYRDAINEGQRTIQEMLHCADYGPDDPDTLVRRSTLGSWTGNGGDAAGARDLFAALLTDRLRVLGPDHPATLITRNNLAVWTGYAGDAARARDLFAALLPDQMRVLGPDHPDALITRSNLAFWTGEAGDAAGARDLFAALLTDRLRVLGPDHPDALTTRNNLAFWTGEAGDAAGARDLFAALLPDQVRVLGPDHPDTLITRSNLAFRTGEAGDAAGARDLFVDLVRDQVRALRPDHPNTLITRRNLAFWTGEAGDAAGARDLFADLVPDQLRALGPDHPKTLMTRNYVAFWTGEAGDAAGARDLFVDLVRDQVRALGPDHPDTLATRDHLAVWTERAGEPAK
jgi:hypothetical protein